MADFRLETWDLRLETSSVPVRGPYLVLHAWWPNWIMWAWTTQSYITKCVWTIFTGLPISFIWACDEYYANCDENTENIGSKICVLPTQTSFTSKVRTSTAHIRGKWRILITVSSNFQTIVRTSASHLTQPSRHLKSKSAASLTCITVLVLWRKSNY